MGPSSDLVVNSDHRVEVFRGQRILGEDRQMGGMKTTRQSHGGPDLSPDSPVKVKER